MNLFETGSAGDVYIGRVRDDFTSYFKKCFMCCFRCTLLYDVERALAPDGSAFEKKFTLRANLCCCGRTNNCCGGTCFRNDAVFDVLDAKGAVVAHLQKTYGAGRYACCRTCYRFDNFVLEFPAASTPEDRLLLLTAIFHLDYVAFERKGGNG